MKGSIQDYAAFTIKGSGRVNSIVTSVGISLPNIPGFPPHPIIPTTALWDTGASNSVLTESVARNMGLKPIDRVMVAHAGGETEMNVYLINISLPNNMTIPGVRVTECVDNQGHFGMIIGMDIISWGDFAISNHNGNTVFTFRIPSVMEIDFVKDYKEYEGKRMIDKRNSMFAPKPVPVVNSHNIGRNDPCYCGSGLKYKKCHGKT